MTEASVVLRQNDTIAVIFLNRPHLSNLISLDIASELKVICRGINEDDNTRVVILTGSGDVFSRGRDAFAHNSDTPDLGIDHWLELHQVSRTLAELKVPSIAAINGDAIDHGLELALACDLRLATRGVKLGFTDLTNGIIPWDGGTQRLARLIGRAKAMELLLTSRKVETKEALSMGLISLVTPRGKVLAAAEGLAFEIASNGPVAVRYTKEAVQKGMDLTLIQGLALEADLSFLLQSTRDRTEGLTSFIEKRKPHYTGK